MKKTFDLRFLLLQILTIGLLSSCNQDESEFEQKITDEFDVTINSIEKKNNFNGNFYQTTKLIDESFNFHEKYIVKGSFATDNKNSSEDIERVYIYDKEIENRILAFSKNKTSDIEKSAIFEYSIKDDKLYVTAYDLNKEKLFDIEVDINTHIGVLTTVYDLDDGSQLTRINGCNASIYAAGIPWTIGFGMINPLAGLAAATFFWALEHAIC